MAKKKQQHGATAAVRALTEAGVAFTELPYEHEEGAGFGAEAAAKLGRDPGQVYKTLMITHDGQFALGVVPVAGKLDMKAAAAAMGRRSMGRISYLPSGPGSFSPSGHPGCPWR